MLDGYHEHTSERVYQTALLCETTAARPGVALLYSASLFLPDAPIPDDRPLRQQWQARARFEVDGYRELRATRLLPGPGTGEAQSPVVDGRGFLPFS